MQTPSFRHGVRALLLFEAYRGGLTLIGVTPGTPGGDISDTGPVATKVLNWGFKYD